jgi:hypothetical protein
MTNADVQVRAFATAHSKKFTIYNAVVVQLKSSLEDPAWLVRVEATNALNAYEQRMNAPMYFH